MVNYFGIGIDNGLTYSNGQRIEAEPAAMAPLMNPANGKAFSKVFMARPDHMARAINAAYAVKDVWGNDSGHGA